MPKRKKVIVRLLLAGLFIVFVAAALPRTLGHPYPATIEPYVVYGGILVYVIGGLGVVAYARQHN